MTSILGSVSTVVQEAVGVVFSFWVGLGGIVVHSSGFVHVLRVLTCLYLFLHVIILFVF